MQRKADHTASPYTNPLSPIRRFKSEKTGRGPLTGADWTQSVQPVMTCYKLVTCEFKWFGISSRVESFIQKSERRLFTNFHRYASNALVNALRSH